MRKVLPLGAAAIVAAAPAAAGAAQKGVGAFYVGASFQPRIVMDGWGANLRLDDARVRDPKGFAAMTLWLTTNSDAAPFGPDGATKPYLAVSVTKGWFTLKGKYHKGLAFVCSQRTLDGTYREGKPQGPVATLGQTYGIGTQIMRDGTVIASVGPDPVCTFPDAATPQNDYGRSLSAFAGAEASSASNTVTGSVTNLNWSSPYSAGGSRLKHVGWSIGNGKGTGNHARLVKRGPASTPAWTKGRKYQELPVSFGPLAG